MLSSKKKGLYVLPSLFTAGNLASGFISIINAIEGNFNIAAWFIMLAIIFDMTDGRIARLTKTMSKFGMEFDSLCDLVSFGVAPAVLMYQLVLHLKGHVGVAIAVLFVVASAIRLAKFNVKAMETAEIKSKSDTFSGLPTPASAGLIASFVLSYEIFDGTVLNFKTIPLLMKKMPFFFETMPVIMLLLAFLMVSTVPYGAFKQIKWTRPKSIQVFFLAIVFIALVCTYPQNTIFIIFLLYVLSGLVVLLVRGWNIKRALMKVKKENENKKRIKNENK